MSQNHQFKCRIFKYCLTHKIAHHIQNKSNLQENDLFFCSTYLLSAPPTLREIEHLLCSVFLLFVDEGLHNYVVCNCVAVKPLRAGAHSLVQAHSFHYYGTLCLRPPLISTIKKQADTNCLFFNFTSVAFFCGLN